MVSRRAEMALRTARRVEQKFSSQSNTEEHRNCESMERVAVACGLGRLLEGVVRRNSAGKFETPSLADPSLLFYSARQPTVSLKHYVFKLLHYTNCSMKVFITALVYMDRLVKKGIQYRLNSLNVHRLVLTTVLIAAKLLEEEPVSLKYFAKLGGITPGELTVLERACLEALNYQLIVSPEQFMFYDRKLCGSVRPQMQRRREAARQMEKFC